MKNAEIISHVTNAVSTWVTNSELDLNGVFLEKMWSDLIVRPVYHGDVAVEILFDGGLCYDMINDEFDSGLFNQETAEELFGLKELEKLGHEAEHNASWKIEVYKK